MEPGYTLCRAWMNNLTAWYVIIVDSAREVVWFDAAPSYIDVRQLENGDLFVPWFTNFVEMNLLEIRSGPGLWVETH
jgi:hypothetical protein